MSIPHTHGGTDAPECTTCRSLSAASDELKAMINLEIMRHETVLKIENQLHIHSLSELELIFSKLEERKADTDG